MCDVRGKLNANDNLNVNEFKEFKGTRSSRTKSIEMDVGYYLGTDLGVKVSNEFGATHGEFLTQNR